MNKDNNIFSYLTNDCLMVQVNLIVMNYVLYCCLQSVDNVIQT